MILRKIQVAGWRCFADPLPPIGPFSEGLNVIHGRNGSGKSTLLWALTRCLFDGHKVGGADIQSLRPWGRSLNPQVTVEFSHQEQEYRIEKRFLGEAMAELSRLEGDQFVRLAEGIAADQQVRELLSGEKPGRGESKPEHWGFAQILWATQGKLRIEKLSDGTRNTIQEALGSQVTGPIAGQIEEKIAEEYSAIYTNTGKLRGGASAPPVVGLLNQLEEARVRREALLVKLEAFDTASRKIEDLRNQTRDARQQEEALADDLKEARKQAEAYRQITSKQQTKQREVENARKDYETLQGRIGAIEEIRGQLTTAETDLKQLQQDSPTQQKVVEQCQTEAEASRDHLQSIRQGRESVNQAARKARQAAKFIEARNTQAQCKRLIEQIEQVRSDLLDLEDERGKLIAPDAATLKKIKKASVDRGKWQTMLDAALIHIEILPEASTTLEVECGEELGQRDLVAGQPTKIKGAPEVVFKIDGVGTIRASGPSESADECRDNLEKSERKLQSLTTGYGTSDVEQLEAIHRRADEMDRDKKALKQQIDAVLGDRSLQEIGEQHKLTSGIVGETIADFPTWETSLPQPDALTGEAEKLQRTFTKNIDEAEARNERAGESLHSAKNDLIRLDEKLRHAGQRTADLEKRLSDLCGKESDKDREEKHNRFALEHAGAKAELAEIEKQLEQFGDDPSQSVGTLENQCLTLRESVATCNDSLKTEEGRLQTIMGEAPYSALNAEEEKIRHFEEEIKRHERHNNAIRLLYETISRCKREVVETLIEPVQRRARQTLSRIQGNRFEGIEFDDSFLPRGIAPKSHGEPVALDYLSGGEQEQVHFAVRLALADVAFKDQRQLLVLDDAFTFTDSAGLARIVTILGEAAERFQIILLSCHPERYSHLPQAKFFDLEALTSAQQHDTATPPDLRLRHTEARPGA